jgi:ligand-binding sensor protein
MDYVIEFLEQANEMNLDDFIKQYYEITGLSCLIKLDGYEEIIGTGRRTICQLFNGKNSSESHLCMQSRMKSLNPEISVFQQYSCPLDLIEYAKPLIINNQVVGYAYVGQVLFNQVEHKVIMKRAEAFGLNINDIEHFYNELPILSKKQMNSHIAFINSILDQWLSKVCEVIKHKDSAKVQNAKLGKELNERFLLDKAYQYISKTGWAEKGSDFLNKTVEFISKLLDVDQVMVSEFIEPNQVQTLAVVDNHVIKNNFVYDLLGTPCENVIGKQFTYFQLNVCECFPDDLALIKNNFKSYAGLPLWKANGEALGLIVLLSRKGFVDKELVEQVLTIFSVRIAHEMQYMNFEKSENEHKRLLEKKVLERTDELTAMNEELIATLEELQSTQSKLVENENQLALTTVVKGLNERLGTPLGNLFMGFSYFDELIHQNKEVLVQAVDAEAVEEFKYSRETIKKSIDQLIEINNSMREILKTHTFGKKEKVDLYESVISTLNTFTIDGMSDQIKTDVKIDKNIELITYPELLDVIMGQLLSFTRSNIGSYTHPTINITGEVNDKGIKFTYMDSNDYNHLELDSLFLPLSNYVKGKKSTGFEMHTVHHVVTERMHGKIHASRSKEGLLTLVMDLPK